MNTPPPSGSASEHSAGARHTALSVVLAGGGSAGHVNPLLATADALRAADPQVRITVLGTADGLEARLVPERGYRLELVPKVPFPRRPNTAALKFPVTLRRSITRAADLIREAQADVVVGFGGYVATPAYLAARRTRTPIVIHEQNARPGLANKLGARFTAHVATTFPSTPLPGAEVIGLPMRAEIADLDRAALREEGLAHFGLRDDRTTLLVFGGSLGAQRLNQAFGQAADDLRAAGVQVLHLTGGGKTVDLAELDADGVGTGETPYVAVDYTDRMDLAYAVADLVVARAGAGTVCELTAVGLPAIYVPLPIGNGEQRLNAQDVVAAGGGLLVDDASVTPDWVRESVLPLLADRDRLAQMADAAAVMGNRDAAEVLAQRVISAARRSTA
ncbi:undecaprenyldiphospho-muramoylpentapeptide beta-N-acetylglucosaminyltransferase [Ornithinimicrobium faecis]|uniref:undecaprenyldiphospho-muramoylpentapeptide beta-N-acetylglucosaminyltransferase n=1 Tax=Ornithinimicrobium faecis TaxID=2934158 RepID=UPI0021191D55|nr:undecaprenyldiphospho-muramoylpentapeptide beta-N-acetylglucosaminyltransferase [Ornithinimicrobium sp. HY1745]